MLGELLYTTPAGDSYVIHFNGGKVTLRKANQRPYEAVDLPWEQKMQLLKTINEALPHGGEW